jgi:hypothetical protein
MKRHPSALLFAAALAFLAVPARAQGPKPGADYATIGANAMWVWYGEPKAVYYEGKRKQTYLGWLSKKGEVTIASIDHVTGHTMTKVINPNWPVDDHNHPSLLMLPDGRLMVIYTGHGAPDVRMQITRDPEDISAFQPEAVIIKGSHYTYPNLAFLSSEGDSGRVYAFVRGVDELPNLNYSDDWGKTWKTNIRLFDVPSDANATPYMKMVSNGKDEIHFMIEGWHRLQKPPIYYMKYKGGNFYHADGTLIKAMAQLPVKDGECDLIMDPRKYGHHATGWDITLDASGRPRCLIDKYKDDDNHVYYYYRWTGSQWVNTRLVNSGKLMGHNDGFAGGVTFDHADPNTIYMCRQIIVAKDSITVGQVLDSTHELDKWTSSDDGLTWDSIPITRNSPKKNVRPCVPRGSHGGKAGLFWLYGDYTGIRDFNMRMNMLDVPATGTAFRIVPKPSGAAISRSGPGFRAGYLWADPGSTGLSIRDSEGRLISTRLKAE